MSQDITALVAASQIKLFGFLESRPGYRAMLEIAQLEIVSMNLLLREHPDRVDIQQVISMWQELEDLRMLPLAPLD